MHRVGAGLCSPRQGAVAGVLLGVFYNSLNLKGKKKYSDAFKYLALSLL
jgi:hypothetical protein